VFLGGGTPTFTEPRELARLLGALPAAPEVTVEANPETVTAEVAALLRARGVTRVSLGAQSFQPRLLGVLERHASPDDVRRAFYLLRDAGFDNISLDLVYGIPGQRPSDLERDLTEALALGPEHLSCYELEAKPGTRFTRAHGEELAGQADAMEGYFEQVVDTLTAGGFRWYETANFCLTGAKAGGRDLRAQHNLGYWRGRDYLGLGIGAVSTIAGERRRNLPSLSRYVASLALGGEPPREVEVIDAETRTQELLLLGLRLDEPVAVGDVAEALDRAALARMAELGLVERSANGRGEELRLTRRGRFLGGGVTAELLA
jgi:oxygen-independent coproporphyrinogen-3 oxidase